MNEILVKLETKRLKVVCLELEDMLSLNQGNKEKEFEEKMGYSIGKLKELDKELLEEFGRLAKEYEESRLWFRLWDIVSIADGKKVGGALFKGGPNKNKEVEIGYGIDDEYQNRGYCTEAIEALVSWALKQDGVLSVTAETEKENLASQRVLQHIGMIKYAETDTDFLWKYPV